MERQPRRDMPVNSGLIERREKQIKVKIKNKHQDRMGERLFYVLTETPKMTQL